MIRWATPADQPAIRELLDATGERCPLYRYDRMDGHALVEEDGGLRGMLWCDFGQPETFIRELAVTERGRGIVAWRLLRAAMRAAQAHGSEGLAGFQYQPDVIDMAQRAGAYVRPGVRVRFPLSAADKWLR